MSSVNYSLNHKGVRLISSEDAWVKNKKGNYVLNKKYTFIGKVETCMPNFILSTSDKIKPKFKGDISSLNRTAKEQIVEHFFDNRGKRNRKTVAYLAIEKK